MRGTRYRAAIVLCAITAAALPSRADKTNDSGEGALQRPTGYKAYIERGTDYCGKAQWDKAIDDFREAVRLDPTNALAYEYLGGAYFGRGDLEKAIATIGQAIRLNPTNARTYLNRASAHDAKGDYDKAASDLAESLRLNPKDANALAMRGFYSCNKGEFDKGVADYLEAIRLDPQNAGAYVQLGWLRATCPVASIRNGKDAVELATKGYELATKSQRWHSLDTLAAAYAEVGDFPRAIRYEKQALGMESVPADYRKELELRLSLFERHQPFHEWHKRQK